MCSFIMLVIGLVALQDKYYLTSYTHALGSSKRQHAHRPGSRLDRYQSVSMEVQLLAFVCERQPQGFG